MPPGSKEMELGITDQEASPSVGKNAGLVVLPCLYMEVCPCSYSPGGVDLSEVLGHHFLQQTSSQ